MNTDAAPARSPLELMDLLDAQVEQQLQWSSQPVPTGSTGPTPATPMDGPKAGPGLPAPRPAERTSTTVLEPVPTPRPTPKRRAPTASLRWITASVCAAALAGIAWTLVHAVDNAQRAPESAGPGLTLTPPLAAPTAVAASPNPTTGAASEPIATKPSPAPSHEPQTGTACADAAKALALCDPPAATPL